MKKIAADRNYRMLKSAGSNALKATGEALGFTGRYFADPSLQPYWNKEAFVKDLKTLQVSLPNLIAHLESIEDRSWDKNLGSLNVRLR
jgi:hypothetical protein